jgi:hypothetical protein
VAVRQIPHIVQIIRTNFHRMLIALALSRTRFAADNNAPFVTDPCIKCPQSIRCTFKGKLIADGSAIGRSRVRSCALQDS